MKKVILTVLFMFFATSAFAATIAWQLPTTGEPDGYKIYYNEFSKDVGNVLTVVDFESVLNLVPGVEYTLSCSAYNNIGEGPKCEPLTYTRLAFAPEDNPAPTIINIPPGSPVTINVGE